LDLPTLTFLGAVFSGSGQGKRFVELPWAKQQLIRITGFTPFAGTLNIRLDEEGTRQRAALEKHQGIEVKPQAGYFPGFLYKATLNGTVCYIVIPKMPSYPKDVIEVIAETNLRRKYGFKDGEKVTVKVTV
jgi:riboflavin kinase